MFQDGGALTLPPLTARLPRMECPEHDLRRSTRGQHLLTTLRNPELQSWSGETPRMMAVERAVLSVREKSSWGLREAIAAADPPPPLTATGRPSTRSAMISARREQQAAESARFGRSLRSTLPVGTRPGAPGKNPQYKRFTHHDVDRLDPKICRQ